MLPCRTGHAVGGVSPSLLGCWRKQRDARLPMVLELELRLKSSSRFSSRKRVVLWHVAEGLSLSMGRCGGWLSSAPVDASLAGHGFSNGVPLFCPVRK